MKIRDLLILIGLVLLILVLTIGEKYADRQREARRLEELTREQRLWRDRVIASFDSRWDDLSAELRTTLDSLAQSAIREGVPAESLAVVVVDPENAPGKQLRESAKKTPSDEPRPKAVAEPSSPPSHDSLAQHVSNEFAKAIAALPSDLNAYERRVATNEVASLIRARFGLGKAKFDSLLRVANK